MKLLSDRSPRTLAALALFAGLMAGSTFILPNLSRAFLWVDVSLGAFLLFGGYFLILKAPSELKNGIQNNRWPTPQIESLRVIAESPIYVIFLVLFFLVYLVTFFAARHSIWRDIGWAAFTVIQSLIQIQNALRRLTPPKSTPIEWRNLTPIHSDHWGKR